VNQLRRGSLGSIGPQHVLTQPHILSRDLLDNKISPQPAAPVRQLQPPALPTYQPDHLAFPIVTGLMLVLDLNPRNLLGQHLRTIQHSSFSTQISSPCAPLRKLPHRCKVRVHPFALAAWWPFKWHDKQAAQPDQVGDNSQMLRKDAREGCSRVTCLLNLSCEPACLAIPWLDRTLAGKRSLCCGRWPMVRARLWA
jgi:hypothetical protein